jgi:hypothetical protein
MPSCRSGRRDLHPSPNLIPNRLPQAEQVGAVHRAAAAGAEAAEAEEAEEGAGAAEAEEAEEAAGAAEAGAPSAT